MTNKVAAIFDICKWEDDYTLEDYTLIHDHPGIEDVFLFHEDLLDGFFDVGSDEWEKLPINHCYRFFVVLAITPTYSNSLEGGNEFDGWEWDTMILTHVDLGEVEDDTPSIQS